MVVVFSGVSLKVTFLSILLIASSIRSSFILSVLYIIMMSSTYLL